MKKEVIEAYEKLDVQIEGLHKEISIISKKSPNDALNKFKLRFVNQILSEVNKILDKKYVPFDDFACFEEDDVPTNSDVVIVLTQYISCLEKFKFDNVEFKLTDWYWKTEEGIGIKTSRPPLKFTY